MPTDYDFADERGRNASEEARSKLLAFLDSIDPIEQARENRIAAKEYADRIDREYSDAIAAMRWLRQIEAQMDVMRRCDGYRRSFRQQYRQLQDALVQTRYRLMWASEARSNEPDFSCASDRPGFAAWLEADNWQEQNLTDRLTHPGCATSAGDNSDRSTS
jgi:hypothetical protein